MFDKIVVVDVEALCWPYDNKKDKRQIIEIGACLLDTVSLEITNTRSIYIKPRYGKVSKFCHSITGITQEDLDEKGLTYSEAIALLKREYKTKSRSWATWGTYDMSLFKAHSDINNMPLAYAKYPFTDDYTDVASLYSILTCRTKLVSLSDAVIS